MNEIISGTPSSSLSVTFLPSMCYHPSSAPRAPVLEEGLFVAEMLSLKTSWPEIMKGVA